MKKWTKELIMDTLEALNYEVIHLEQGIVISVPKSTVSVKDINELQDEMKKLRHIVPEEEFNSYKSKIKAVLDTEDGGEHDNDFGRRIDIGTQGIKIAENRKDVILNVYLSRIGLGFKNRTVTAFGCLDINNYAAHYILKKFVEAFLELSYEEYCNREFIAFSGAHSLNIASYFIEGFSFASIVACVEAKSSWNTGRALRIGIIGGRR